jgi:predicted O-methyltransferase YrrM
MMPFTFHPSDKVIAAAVAKLIKHNYVHPDAVFIANAPGGLRREVTYRDADFTYRLGRTAFEEHVVDDALAFLKELDLAPEDAAYDKAAFEALRQVVKKKFKGSWTSFSPVMERLVYMLVSVRQPKRLVELGSFWGYTLAWFAGPCIGEPHSYTAEKIYGIEVDAKMTARARANFAKLPNTEAVELIAEDARTAIERISAPVDFLYLEAKHEDQPCPYLELLQQMYDKLPAGAWVMAHDPLDYGFHEEIATYLAFVRDRAHFAESICFDVDECGLELSIK